MTFIEFLCYDLILFIIKFVICLFLYRFFVKKKCNILSDIASKQIADYFDTYDDTIESTESQEPTQF